MMGFEKISPLEGKEIIPGFFAQFVHSKNMTFAFWNIKKDAILPEHSHIHEQVAVMVEGLFELTVDDETKVIGKGDVAVIPSNSLHSGRAITDCKIMDAFCPVRDDYL